MLLIRMIRLDKDILLMKKVNHYHQEQHKLDQDKVVVQVKVFMEKVKDF